jgi:hypothetical protein
VIVEVDSDDVAALRNGDIETVVPIVTVMARAYTRGRGFTDGEPNEVIAAVIVTAAARLAGNTEQLARKKVDDVEYEYTLRGSFG